jgi:hypothetical protein
MMHSVGFEPTSTNTLRPERSSLDRSDNCAMNTASFGGSEMTSTGIEPAAFGTGIRRATIAPTSQTHFFARGEVRTLDLWLIRPPL